MLNSGGLHGWDSWSARSRSPGILNTQFLVSRYSVSERLGFCFLRVPPAHTKQASRAAGCEKGSGCKHFLARQLKASTHGQTLVQALPSSTAQPHCPGRDELSPEGRGLAVRLCPLEVTGAAAAAAAPAGGMGAARAAAAAATALSRGALAGRGGT